MQPFRGNCAETGIGVAQNQQRVGAYRRHKLVAAVYNVAHRFAQISARGVHINVRLAQSQFAEKYAA